MHHQQRGGGAEFDGEVAVGNGVERIFADAGETQRGGDRFAVNRVSCACQRRSAQRQHVGASTRIGKALAIAPCHLEPGEQMVAEGDGLGNLHVGESGHGRFGFAFGEIEQACLKSSEQVEDGVDRIAQP